MHVCDEFRYGWVEIPCRGSPHLWRDQREVERERERERERESEGESERSDTEVDHPDTDCDTEYAAFRY